MSESNFFTSESLPSLLLSRRIDSMRFLTPRRLLPAPNSILVSQPFFMPLLCIEYISARRFFTFSNSLVRREALFLNTLSELSLLNTRSISFTSARVLPKAFWKPEMKALSTPPPPLAPPLCKSISCRLKSESNFKALFNSEVSTPADRRFKSFILRSSLAICWSIRR